MSRPLNQQRVRCESVPFVGTCGDSATAQHSRFLPAFQNSADGRVELAKLPNGHTAPMHLICALPTHWAARCDEHGKVIELIDGIVAGFVREGQFFTREQAAAAP